MLVAMWKADGGREGVEASLGHSSQKYLGLHGQSLWRRISEAYIKGLYNVTAWGDNSFDDLEMRTMG